MPRWLNDPRFFARGWAAILLALVLVGFTSRLLGVGALLPGLLEFDLTHDLLHVGLLLLAVYMGWRAPLGQAVVYARVFGVFGLLVAIAGFIPPAADAIADASGWHFELLENIVHAAVAVWGIMAGFRTHAAPIRAASQS